MMGKRPKRIPCSCEKARVSARAIEVTRKDATIIHCFCLRTGSIYRTNLIAYVRDDFEMTERSEAKFVKCRSQRLDSSEPIREAEFSMTRKKLGCFCLEHNTSVHLSPPRLSWWCILPHQHHLLHNPILPTNDDRCTRSPLLKSQSHRR